MNCYKTGNSVLSLSNRIAFILLINSMIIFYQLDNIKIGFFDSKNELDQINLFTLDFIEMIECYKN